MGERNMQTAVQCKKCGKTYSAGVVNQDFQGLCPGCVAAFAFEEVSQSPLEAPAPAAITMPTDDGKTTMYLKPGTVIQGVAIETVLGQGGMGVVYKGRQLGLDRPVALKVMSDRLAGDADFVKRFEKEAKAMATLSHANIVAVYNYGIDNGRCFIVMEFVDGANLRHIIREKKLRPDEALKIVPQLCDALDYAHSEGVVHRDIKPENILIDKKGRVKITDFGLAKMVEPGRLDHTVTGLVMGTPHYMAPEQVEAPKDVDHRADIYSMGVVFYELLTGELPIGRWQLPSQHGGLDSRLDQVVLRALERQPDKRYQNASDMKLEVSRVSEFIPVARLATAQPAQVSAFPGGVHAPSPASPNAGWSAPAGFAPIRPNVPASQSRMSPWVGTGFGLTIASIVMAFSGLLVIGSSHTGHPQAAELVATFGLGGLLGTFGFLCNTIGLFDILFNSSRRHGFGMAVLTYAMDLLWIGVAIVAFLFVQAPASSSPVATRTDGSATSTSLLVNATPFIPPGWNIAPESRRYSGEGMDLFWKSSGLPVAREATRARRIVYVSGAEGAAFIVNIIERAPEQEVGLLAAAGSPKFRASISAGSVVVYQVSNPGAPLDEGNARRVQDWVREMQAKESEPGR